jgi:hypothetical protein
MPVNKKLKKSNRNIRVTCTSHLANAAKMQRKLFGINGMDFNVTGPLLLIYSAFIKYSRKNWNTIKLCISYLWTSRKPMI